MRDQIADSGFTLLESDFLDLDIYIRDRVVLILMKKFKADRKAFRVAGNHIDLDLISELKSAFDIYSKDESVSGIILTSGHKVVFSRGAKIEQLKDVSAEECEEYILQAQNLICSIQNSARPVVAALNGLTLGGGLELALACDYRIASSRENVILGFPEAHLGVLPAMGGVVNGKIILGAELIYNIIHNYRLDIDAASALECGLIEKVAEPEDLIEQAFTLISDKADTKRSRKITGRADRSSDEYQQEIVEFLRSSEPENSVDLKIAPIPAQLLPFLLEKVNPENLVESLRYEREVFCYLQQTEDCIEGITALIEERAPRFSGK